MFNLSKWLWDPVSAKRFALTTKSISGEMFMEEERGWKKSSKMHL